jgi:hypothetical protein
MSPSPDQDETFAPVAVNLTCEFPGAELLLINGQLELVARDVGKLEKSITPGVYTARVRIGNAERDEPLVVRPDIPVTRTLSAPKVASAIPLEGSASSHEYHQDAARSAAAPAALALDPAADAEIFLLLREWTAGGQGRHELGGLAEYLALCAADGSELHRYDTSPVTMPGGDRAVAIALGVKAGFYRLRSIVGDLILELPIYALKNWQTQIYLLSVPCERDGKPTPDFARASILWSRPRSGFHPESRDLQLLEAARIALESGQGGITDEALRDFLFEKFENPMLGLLSAHALVQRNRIEPALLTTVIDNLERTIGPLPDLLALKLAVDPNAELPTIELVPMLRRSWVALLERSVDQPTLIKRRSLAERVGSCVTGQSIWMVWRELRSGSSPALESVAADDEVVALARDTLRRVRASAARTKLGPDAIPTLEATGGDRPQDAEALAKAMKRIVRLLGVPRAAIDDESS